jgi:hypothetical protein
VVISWSCERHQRTPAAIDEHAAGGDARTARDLDTDAVGRKSHRPFDQDTARQFARRADQLPSFAQQRIRSVDLRRGIEQSTRRVILAAERQQPCIENGSGHHLPVRACRVSAERHRAAVFAGLHVGAHQRHLGIGRVLHQRARSKAPSAASTSPRTSATSRCTSNALLSRWR